MGNEWERAPESPRGACSDMASFCKAPPSAEQLEQQQREDGQKLKQQVQKQRADKWERAAEAAKQGK